MSYQAVSKLLPKHISIFLVDAYAFLTGAIFMFFVHLFLSQDKSVILNSKAFLLSIGIGILVSIGTLFVIKGYSLGAQQAQFNGIYSPSFVIFGIIFGLLFFNEKLNLIQVFGASLSIIGILLMIYFKK